jgi:hypothetical protein
VNADLTPALIAAGGGSAMLGGIWLHERRRIEAMRTSLTPLSLRFPLGLEATQAQAALEGLAGLPSTCEIVAELAAREGAISHRLWVPRALLSPTQASLTGAVASLRMDETESSPADAATLVAKLFVPTPTLLSDGNVVAASQSLLAGLAMLRSGEQVVVRLCLRPQRPRPLPERDNPTAAQRETARAWQRETQSPGFATSGLVLIRASKSRARELASQIESLLRSRRGHTGGLRLTFERGSRRLNALPQTRRSSGWLSGQALLGLLGWPLGSELTPGVELGGRQVRAANDLPTGGRRLLLARSSSGQERPVALSAEAARHHMAVIGPSGVGKSALLTNAILADIAAGYGGAVIDPKADMIGSILSRVPAEHGERIVVLDPGDRARPLAGLAVLSGGDPDDRADVLTGTLKAIFAGAWGVRSDFYGRLAIRTLSEVPGATLADMGRLFYEEPYRRAAIARLRDPFLIASWQSYEGLSEAAKAEHVQAPMARVMTLLSRPRVRAVLAAPEPKLDIPRLFAARKWLLVSLAPGVLSEPGATLVGAAVMYAIWSAIETRVNLGPAKRHPIFLYVDELATLTNGMPFGFEQLAERARGLGAGLTVAIQTLGRIGEPTRSALIGNVATLITFRAGATEAPRLARELPGMSAADLQALGRFEVAARIGTGGGSSVRVVTGRTQPLPPETGQAEAIRDRTATDYGSPQTATPSASPVVPPPDETAPPGRVRRQP